MVEFTIVLPLLLLLIVGVTELGRVMVRHNALTKSVQDGVRYAAAYAIRGTTGTVTIDTQLQNEVRNLVVFGNVGGTGAPVLAGLATSQIAVVDNGGGEVRVDADYPYEPLTGPLETFGLGPAPVLSFNMRASVTMRAL
jgi:Flp pilus assembly protein TadG